MKMKTQLIKICGMLGKQCIEGNLALNAYVRKGKRYAINHLNFCLKKLEKEEQIEC